MVSDNFVADRIGLIFFIPCRPLLKAALRKVIGMKEAVFTDRIACWEKAYKDMPRMAADPSLMGIGVQIINSHFWLFLTYAIAGINFHYPAVHKVITSLILQKTKRTTRQKTWTP